MRAHAQHQCVAQGWGLGGLVGARCQGRGPSPSPDCNPQASGPLRRVLHGSHLGYHTPNLQGGHLWPLVGLHWWVACSPPAAMVAGPGGGSREQMFGSIRVDGSRTVFYPIRAQLKNYYGQVVRELGERLFAPVGLAQSRCHLGGAMVSEFIFGEKDRVVRISRH